MFNLLRLIPLWNAEGDIGAAASTDPGVDLDPVAGDPVVTDPQTGVDTPDVAGQVTDEKGFAAALKARETQLQKQYEEKYKGVETQAQMLDRVAKYYGYANNDEFQAVFEQAERDKRAREEAERLGMDEELYQKFLQPVNEKLSEYEKTIQSLKQQDLNRQIDAEVTKLKGQYSDFEQHQNQVFDMAIQKGYQLEDAYIIVTHEAKVEAARKESEQRVLANVTGRDNKQVLPSSDKPGDMSFDPDKMSLKDIEEVSRRVQRGERIVL